MAKKSFLYKTADLQFIFKGFGVTAENLCWKQLSENIDPQNLSDEFNWKNKFSCFPPHPFQLSHLALNVALNQISSLRFGVIMVCETLTKIHVRHLDVYGNFEKIRAWGKFTMFVLRREYQKSIIRSLTLCVSILHISWNYLIQRKRKENEKWKFTVHDLCELLKRCIQSTVNRSQFRVNILLEFERAIETTTQTLTCRIFYLFYSSTSSESFLFIENDFWHFSDSINILWSFSKLLWPHSVAV